MLAVASVLPQTPSWFQGAALRQDKDGVMSVRLAEGKEGLGEGLRGRDGRKWHRTGMEGE